MSVKTLRIDPEIDRAISYLGEELGTDSFSIIARYALLEVADQRRRAALRAESEALRNDPADIAEMREVMADMEALSAW